MRTSRTHGRAGELRRQVEDVPGAGAAEAVHGLGVVADRGQPGVAGAQAADDVDLQLVDVLVLVDQHVRRTARPAGGRARRRGRRPASRAAGRRSRAGPGTRLRATYALITPAIGSTRSAAQGAVSASGLRQRPAGVDRPGVEVEQQALARGTPAGPGQPLLLPDQVEQVGGVGRVEHREVAGQAERGGVGGDDPVRDRVERAAPGPRTAGWPNSRVARPSISAAARRVNVSSSTRCAGTPRSSSRATRAVSVVVFPVPAPASTSSGPPSCSTAARCSSFSSNTRSTLPAAQRSVGAPLRESR